ncbi:MAG: hypothetical protein BWY74_00810 [Firmicutes bacterium ADurb.Bin419]|nr:MAG: hypothetical protein BWY74_00810 [Firmicutes bacterium ADurb.Bin419]
MCCFPIFPLFVSGKHSLTSSLLSWIRLAGKRPSGLSSKVAPLSTLSFHIPPFGSDHFLAPTPTLLSSIFIPPVPYLRTFSATVFSDRCFRAIQIVSCAGLRAVPQPSHSEVPLVISSSFACPKAPPPIAPLSSATATPFCAWCFISPVAIRSFPCNLSTAFPIFKLLGKPDPYTHSIISLTSNPASSIATAIL